MRLVAKTGLGKVNSHGHEAVMEVMGKICYKHIRIRMIHNRGFERGILWTALVTLT